MQWLMEAQVQLSNYLKWAGFPNDYIALYKFILQTTYYTDFFLDNKFVKHLQHHPEALTEIASSLINLINLISDKNW